MEWLDYILGEENIQTAIDFLKTKKNSCGDDGVWLHDIDEYWKLNKRVIVKNIKTGEYHPQIIHEKIILKANGKHRKIALLSSIDRMLLRAILQVIQQPLEQRFSPYSFAYQIGKSVNDAVKCAVNFIEQGREYVVKIDIKDFFDSINHFRLLTILEQNINDSQLYNLLEKFIVCTVETDYKLIQKNQGIIQGNPISPLFSNLYLNELDTWMQEKKYKFVRFADDINVYVSSIQEGCDIQNEIEKKLKNFDLEINPDKSGIYSVFSKPYLGYDFEKAGNEVFIKKHKWNGLKHYSQWHQSAIEKMENNYYLVNEGILTKKDFTILFENKEKKVYIPVETTDSLNIFSDVQMGSGFFDIVNKYSLNINVFNQYGTYIGSFYSGRQRNRMKCLMKQVEIYSDRKKRLYYVKIFEIASLHNIRCNLRYYNKHYTSDILRNSIEEISGAVDNIKYSDSYGEIVLLEARSRQKYYQCINEMVQNAAFSFQRRTKRPPQDPINAMISFGNTYLYQKIAQIIYRTSVDIRISFVHSAIRRYENLNLDIADIFKPIIVDKTIFSLINKRMICSEKHFETLGKGVFLNTEGKQIFLEGLNRKMKQMVSIGGDTCSYENLIYQNIRNLEKSILTGSKYKAYKHQM